MMLAHLTAKEVARVALRTPRYWPENRRGDARLFLAAAMSLAWRGR